MFKIFILLLATTGEPKLFISNAMYPTLEACEKERLESVADFVTSNSNLIVPGMVVSKCLPVSGLDA